MLSKKTPLYDWSNKKILIVDDVLEVYQLLSIYLRETKAKQLYAENGIEAIELCKQNPDIDLILLDIQLPDIDGFETFKKIKQIRNEIPVIAQTAFALNSDKERAMLAGFSDYITKPIYKKTLLKHISKFF
jgi:CheY-like chemotaxis protein